METKRIIWSVIILLLCGSLSDSYKKDHGFGYLYKHDPNVKQREKTEKLTNDKIRHALGIGRENKEIFPEPFSVNDIQLRYSGTTMSFSGVRIYGLDHFRPLHITSDFTNLVISFTLLMDQITGVGNFRMTPWVGNSQGSFNYTIEGAWLSFEAEMLLTNAGSEEEGLRLGKLETKLTYDNIHLDFDNIGVLNTLLKPVKNSIGKYIFSQISPTLRDEGELKVKLLLSNVLQSLPRDSTKAINDVDRALIRSRQSIKSAQLDPLDITDHYPKTGKLIKLELTQGKLSGLSSLRRVGPILVGYERNSVHMNLHFGVENLKGQYAWTWTLWKHLLTNRGTLHFTVEDIAIKVNLAKVLNAQDNLTRVENITMSIGSINLVSDGMGAVKYIMETFLNVVPDSFRQRIMESAEYRLLTVIEDEVKKIDFDELVEDDDTNSLEDSTA